MRIILDADDMPMQSGEDREIRGITILVVNDFMSRSQYFPGFYAYGMNMESSHHYQRVTVNDVKHRPILRGFVIQASIEIFQVYFGCLRLLAFLEDTDSDEQTLELIDHGEIDTWSRLIPHNPGFQPESSRYR